jgi:hypothetical protein
VESERLELATFAPLLNAAIGVNASRRHDTLKHAGQTSIATGALSPKRRTKFRFRSVTAWQ